MQNIIKSVKNWVREFLDLETQDERDHPEKYMSKEELERTRTAIRWMNSGKAPYR